jgi:Nuclease-related domain
VRCPSCVEDNPSSTPAASTASIGTPGGSAEREYLLRSQRHRRRTEARIADDGAWRQQVKKDHPVLGRLAAAITAKPVNDPEPNHVASWKVGADGERKVGARLDRWAHSMGGRVLHDRRIPGTKANIDHIALNANAVWVIDTKEYAGTVTASAGGLFSGPELRVAGRLRTDLADAVVVQMEQVAAALNAAAGGGTRPPVYGVLCFVDADWPRFGGTFLVRGVRVAWPGATVKLLTRGGRPTDVVSLDRWTKVLASAFPPA